MVVVNAVAAAEAGTVMVKGGHRGVDRDPL